MHLLYLALLLKPIHEIKIDPDFIPQRIIPVRDRIVFFDPTKSYLLSFNPDDLSIDSLLLEGATTKNLLTVASDGLKIYLLTTEELLTFDWNGGFLGKKSVGAYIDFDLYPPDGFFFLERGGNYLTIESRGNFFQVEILFRGEHIRYIGDSKYILFGEDGIEVFEIPGVNLKKLEVPAKDAVSFDVKIIFISNRKIYSWDFKKGEISFYELETLPTSLFIYEKKLILGERGGIEFFDLSTLFPTPTK